jgi:hypothetical protein
MKRGAKADRKKRIAELIARATKHARQVTIKWQGINQFFNRPTIAQQQVPIDDAQFPHSAEFRKSNNARHD